MSENLKVKIGVQLFLFTGAMILLGTSEQRDLIQKAARGDAPGCFAMTERDHGSNVRFIETEAVFDKSRDGFLLNTPHPGAAKWYIGNAAQHGEWAVVFAKLLVSGHDEGPHAFVVQLRADGKPCPGVTLEDNGWKGGLNGIDNGRISFADVFVPRASMLSRFAHVDSTGVYHSEFSDVNKRFYSTMSAMNPTRLVLVGASSGAMKRALYIAIRYGFNRRQFGPPGRPEVSLMTYTTHQSRLMPLLAQVYAIDFTRQQATQQMQSGGAQVDREMIALCSGLKFYATNAAAHALQTCRECCGGQGFMMENLIVGMRQDQDIQMTFDGDNTVLKQQVAKDLLDQYRRQFSHGRFTGMLSFIGTRVSNMLKENVPSFLHFIDERRVCDSDWQQTLFSYCEGKILATLAMRLRRKVESHRKEPFDAWNECLDHISSLASSHIERLLHAAFVQAINDCSDLRARSALKQLCDLFALSCILQNRSWYLEQGYFSKGDVRTIRSTYRKLCLEVSRDSLYYLDAFAIPKECVDAPIAHGLHSRL
eukprot:TRINITY_DN1447_c0_g1_i1.p1 TRINITY_DN1447_c0_g1~~TRINITY_DN1447_c0_g1_i1.p1  ORF type:complete len:536 (+),score=62.98 TRINITY_DN1447_c0_g1_i1:401-2008(+)